jgi:hypothetical protein
MWFRRFGSRVYLFEVRVWGLKCRAQGVGCRGRIFEFWVPSCRFGWGVGFSLLRFMHYVYEISVGYPVAYWFVG